MSNNEEQLFDAAWEIAREYVEIEKHETTAMLSWEDIYQDVSESDNNPFSSGRPIRCAGDIAVYVYSLLTSNDQSDYEGAVHHLLEIRDEPTDEAYGIRADNLLREMSAWRQEFITTSYSLDEFSEDEEEEEEDRYDYQHEADTFLPQDESLEITGHSDNYDVMDDEVDSFQPSERAGNAARQAYKRPAKQRIIKTEEPCRSLDETVENARSAAAYQESHSERQKNANKER